jgi:hypothetical protein
VHKALKSLYAKSLWAFGHYSITPNIVMIYIDIQGEEHHFREEQEL